MNNKTIGWIIMILSIIDIVWIIYSYATTFVAWVPATIFPFITSVSMPLVFFLLGLFISKHK